MNARQLAEEGTKALQIGHEIEGLVLKELIVLICKRLGERASQEVRVSYPRIRDTARGPGRRQPDLTARSVNVIGMFEL